MSLPFFYKIKNKQIKNELSQFIFDKDNNNYDQIESDIWNTFGNLLPIEMPLV